MKTVRNPQLSLKLDTSEPDPAERWHEGALIAFLGQTLSLALGTPSKEAVCEDTVLHLPLPPQATPRQIQDRAEAWLRDEAKRYLNRLIAQKSALAGRLAPQLSLSFSARGHWIEVLRHDALRCNWRLIEQSPSVIDTAVSHAVATLPPRDSGFDDLFGGAMVAIAPAAYAAA